MDPIEETKQDLQEIIDDPATPDEVREEAEEIIEKYESEDDWV